MNEYTKQNFKSGEKLYASQLNEMDEQIEKNAQSALPTPFMYGAKGDGTTDDTGAFQEALAQNRVVYVPGGTYKLSNTIIIRQNCRLELAQDTVLNFSQTSGNCIEMCSSATLNGNHANIYVPYSFTGNIICCDADFDYDGDTPPFTHWDPQWKRTRYIYDVCLVKSNSSGLHYSTDGTCSGTAIYMHCDGNSVIPFMWGCLLQGIRIAGAFSFGIQVLNVDDPDDSAEDDAWNHDMRIEAVIQGCEVGVSLTNCNTAHIAASVQPIKAENATTYAKWGIYLNDCRGTDLSSSIVWDWNENNSLWVDGGEYQHIAMIGQCRGTVLSDYSYYEVSGHDIRDLIYTDTPSNLEQMTILQEPITRWFKPVDGEPYFCNNGIEKKLITQEVLDNHFDTDIVKSFTDVLPSATDGSGSVFNEIGYMKNGYYIAATGAMEASDYYGCTGYIPVKAGDTVYVHGITIPSAGDGWAIFVLYDSSYNKAANLSTGNEGFQNGSNYYFHYTALDSGFKVVVAPNYDPTTTAYLRFGFKSVWVKDTPMVAVNEEIKYTYEGFLADGIKVKAENIVGEVGGGANIDVTAEVGQTIVVKEVDENSNPTKWEAVNFPDTYTRAEIDEIMGESINEINELVGGED